MCSCVSAAAYGREGERKQGKQGVLKGKEGLRAARSIMVKKEKKKKKSQTSLREDAPPGYLGFLTAHSVLPAHTSHPEPHEQRDAGGI